MISSYRKARKLLCGTIIINRTINGMAELTESLTSTGLSKKNKLKKHRQERLDERVVHQVVSSAGDMNEAAADVIAG